MEKLGEVERDVFGFLALPPKLKLYTHVLEIGFGIASFPGPSIV